MAWLMRIIVTRREEWEVGRCCRGLLSLDFLGFLGGALPSSVGERLEKVKASAWPIGERFLRQGMRSWSQSWALASWTGTQSLNV